MKTNGYAYYYNSTEEQREFVENEIKRTLTNQTSLVDELFAKEFFSCDDIINYRIDEEDEREIMQWFFISDDLIKDKLIKLNEPVLKSDFGNWWGRTGCGQSVVLDDTFWDILKLEIEGSKDEHI